MNLNLKTYSISAVLATLFILGYQYYTYREFYPTLLSLSRSQGSLFILGNFGFVMSLGFGHILKEIFLGKLSDNEIEVYTLISILFFYMIIFNSSIFDLQNWTNRLLIRVLLPFLCLLLSHYSKHSLIFTLTFPVIVMLIILFFFKCFHWIIQKRLDFIGIIQISNVVSYLRITTLIILFLFFDSLMIMTNIHYQRSADIFVLFKFEFVLLFVMLFVVTFKYIVAVYDLFRHQAQWIHKSVIIMYIELIESFVRLALNIVIFIVMSHYIGLPIHFLRQLMGSFIMFRRRTMDYLRYRRATHNMSFRFPDATQEELAQTHFICIICREDMNVGNGKKLPCGHIFHLRCLKEWLEHQQSCPTCRLSVIAENVSTVQMSTAHQTQNEREQGNVNADQVSRSVQHGTDTHTNDHVVTDTNHHTDNVNEHININHTVHQHGHIDSTSTNSDHNNTRDAQDILDHPITHC